MKSRVLGRIVRGSVDKIDVVQTPKSLDRVTLDVGEFTSKCPVTGQPDFSRILISYAPGRTIVESKSLKLFLQRYRDRGIMAEYLADELADELFAQLVPNEITVTVYQNPRGGIAISASASRSLEATNIKLRSRRK